MKKTMLSTKQSYLVCFIGILAAFGIVMALCESGLADSYIKGIMMTACIAIIMTTSLNLTIGVLGQLTLGCCGFEAIGAYVAALTSKYMVAAGIAIDPTARFLLTTLIGGVVACVFGILIGIPALRLHGDYLAIITLGFGEIIRVIIQNLKVAGGMGLDKGAAGQALIGIERTPGNASQKGNATQQVPPRRLCHTGAPPRRLHYVSFHHIRFCVICFQHILVLFHIRWEPLAPRPLCRITLPLSALPIIAKPPSRNARYLNRE